MAQRPAVDPARLEGEALRRWYSRTPQEIEQERRAGEAQKYADYFGTFKRIGAAQSFGQTRMRLAGDARGGTQRDSTMGGQLPSTAPQGSPNKDGSPIKQHSEDVRVAAPARPDPYRTEVFQPGPDGKLHPVPGWHTTGPTDFDAWSHNVNWGGVAKDLTWTAGNALTFMDGAGLVEGLVESLGPKLGFDAIKRGLIHGHHPDPKFMGGRNKQELVEMVASFHRKMHQRLGAELRKAGFPPQGGTTGKYADWEKFFLANPAARERAVEILRRTTQDFDIEHGTSILPYLEKELRIVTPKSAPAPKVPPPR